MQRSPCAKFWCTEALGAHTACDKHAIVGLQEVDNRTTRSDGLNEPQCIDDNMGTGWANAFVPAMSYQGGTFGNASLYKVPKHKEQEWFYAWSAMNHSDFGIELALSS